MLSPNQRRAQNCRFLLFTILGILVLLGAGIIAFFSFRPPSGSTGLPGNKVTPSSSSSSAIGVDTVNNESIGLSDGTYAFDIGTDRADRELKLQASAFLKKKDATDAVLTWNRAVGKAGNDTSDAETLIYAEDQRVVASGQRYITLVIGTTLTGNTSAIGTGRDSLQGAYLSQKEYNDGLKLNGGIQIRLLIANAGGRADNVAKVAQRIVQAAKQDQTIVGVMGWPYSAYTHNAIPVLGSAKIPLVSPTASADDLTNASPFFFRVAPANETQAVASANYAREKLHASRVAIFVDHNNAYSNSLAADFQKHFAVNGSVVVDTESYTVGDSKELPLLLQKALSFKPDLIYFSGYSDDMAVLLINLPDSQPNLQVLGGDALYQLNGYPSSARAGFSRLHFTAFAYPDEWDILQMGEQPLFFSEYKAAFNPAAQYPNGKYGYTRADNDVILSYDATFALLQGCKNALDAGETLVTPTALKDGLGKITVDHPIQGVSGQIAFGSDGNPVNKAIVVLAVDPDGHIRLQEVQGCFRVGCS